MMALRHKVQLVGTVLVTCLLSAAALAQAPAVTVGAVVKDSTGGAVGTVTAVQGTTATVRTDKHEVSLPVASFTPHNGALLIGMTRAALNAEVEKSLATAQAALAPGATVRGTAGAVVGTLESIDTAFATVRLTSGKLVRIPRAGIAPGTGGAVIGITAGELEAAAQVTEPSS